MRISSDFNSLLINLRFHDKKTNAFAPIFDFIGQEIIDRRNAPLYRAIAENDYKGLQQAIKLGALVNANDHFGHSPLHYASYKGNAGFVDFILRNGGNPNAQSQHLSTPLHSAAWGRNLKVAELLLEDGANVNAQTDEGETPAMTAALRGEKVLLETLLALSADPHAKDIHGSNLYDLASAGGHTKILDLLDDLKVKNNHPFHSAAGRGDLNTIKKMLKNGREINERDAFGATPLLIATVSGKVDIVSFLLNRKADPKITAKDGYTMMHAAAFSGKKELVKLAYNLGLDVNARYGKDGVTPVDVGEDASDALPYLQSLGGRRGWELGRHIEK
jgi:ankyrin repeat protein